MMSVNSLLQDREVQEPSDSHGHDGQFGNASVGASSLATSIEPVSQDISAAR